jgi:hypothetical protein
VSPSVSALESSVSASVSSVSASESGWPTSTMASGTVSVWWSWSAAGFPSWEPT